MRLSVLIPIFNELALLPELFDRLDSVLEKLEFEYEIICVDDGSNDDSLKFLLEKANRDPRIKVVSFSRNFGKEAALTAAIDYASGDAVIPLDADLQHPPELISRLVEEWQQGHDVVHARRASRAGENAVKRLSAVCFYKIFNLLSETKLPQGAGDFCLLSRRAADVVRQLPEKDRFMKGLFAWPGFNSTMVEYESVKRTAGSSRFSFWTLWNFAISGVTSFSSIPIRVGTYIGLFISFISILYGLYIVLRTVIHGIDVPGYASLMAIILFLGGVQLFFLGILGEYLGRIFKEVKGRPCYVVAQATGFDEDIENSDDPLGAQTKE